jgi:DNA-binding transcriptional MerR regulator
MSPTATNRHPDEAPEFLGVFAPHLAGALAGVSGNRVGQWARRRLIRPTYYEGRPANLYSFYDVAEAIVVHWLYDRGFEYEAVHNAIAKAREDHPSWPLLHAPLGVAQHAVEGDPRGAIVLEKDRGVFVDTSARGDQITLRPELLEDFARILRRGGDDPGKARAARAGRATRGRRDGAPDLGGGLRTRRSRH